MFLILLGSGCRIPRVVHILLVLLLIDNKQEYLQAAESLEFNGLFDQVSPPLALNIESIAPIFNELW